MMKSGSFEKRLAFFNAARKSLRPLPSAYNSMFFMVSYFYTSAPDVWLSLRTVLLFLSSSLMLGSIFGINNVTDAEVDKKNPRTMRWGHNPIARGEIDKKSVVLLSCLAAIVGFTIYLFAFHFKALALLSFMLFLGLIYSVKPIRLKERPPLDVLSHGLYFGTLPFLIGARINGELSSEILLLSMIFFNISVMYELWNEVLDYEYDREAGVKTLATIFGKRKIKMLFLLFVPLNLILAVLSSVRILGFSFLTAYTVLNTLNMLKRETMTRLTFLLVFPTAVCIILKV